MSRIIGINGSARSDDCCSQAIDQALDAALTVAEDMQATRIDLADYRISGCLTCDVCADYGRCGINDNFNELLPQLTDPTVVGIIIAAPAHQGSLAAQVKAFLDRSLLIKRNGLGWDGRLGAAISVARQRHGGQEAAIQAIQAAMLHHGMLVCADPAADAIGACVWERSDGRADQEGFAACQALGRRLAALVHRQRSKS